MDQLGSCWLRTCSWQTAPWSAAAAPSIQSSSRPYRTPMARWATWRGTCYNFGFGSKVRIWTLSSDVSITSIINESNCMYMHNYQINHEFNLNIYWLAEFGKSIFPRISTSPAFNTVFLRSFQWSFLFRSWALSSEPSQLKRLWGSPFVNIRASGKLWMRCRWKWMIPRWISWLEVDSPPVRWGLVDFNRFYKSCPLHLLLLLLVLVLLRRHLRQL